MAEVADPAPWCRFGMLPTCSSLPGRSSARFAIGQRAPASSIAPTRGRVERADLPDCVIGAYRSLVELPDGRILVVYPRRALVRYSRALPGCEPGGSSVLPKGVRYPWLSSRPPR